MYPLHARSVRAAGLTFHYEAGGPAGGPPAVLVHGLVVSGLYFRPTAHRLAAAGYRVLVPDLPGFGRSSKPRRALDVPALADALLGWMTAVGLERPALVANSLGCQVVVDLAARRPERAGPLILAGPTMDPRAGVLRHLARWASDEPRERPSLAAIHVRDTLRAGPRRGWRTFRHALADPIAEKLPRVRSAALVVRGERDPIAPQGWAEEVARRLPRGRLVVLPGAPHCVNYSAPDAFTRSVTAFLAGEGWGAT